MKYPAIGSRWTEMDPRFGQRIIIVREIDLASRRPRVRIDCNGRCTWALASRFDGKPGGYKLTEDFPDERADMHISTRDGDLTTYGSPLKPGR